MQQLTAEVITRNLYRLMSASKMTDAVLVFKRTDGTHGIVGVSDIAIPDPLVREIGVTTATLLKDIAETYQDMTPKDKPENN